MNEMKELRQRVAELDVTETKCKMATKIIGKYENTEKMNSSANMTVAEATRWE